jgi:murein hydrolase activator
MRRKRLMRVLAGSGLLGIVLGAATVQARSDWRELGERLGQALEAELGLARQAMALERAVVALERERAGAEHGVRMLAHAGRQGLQQLAVYREGRDERERIARQRARAMVKVARGGIARIALEDQGQASSSAERLARGRDLRWLVRHDLRELAAYQRAAQRAGAELLAAERQLQALSVLATMHDVQSELLETARAATTPALERAGWMRQQLSYGPWMDAAHRERLSAVYASRDALQTLRRNGVDGPMLVRPVAGAVVGRFGSYTDPVLRLPMVRNGVELKARRDEDVRAPAGGHVVMVADLPGFERVVVIDHGEQELSMLGRLWKVTVAEGDRVAAREVIGSVAPKAIDDGLGTTAYLELRHGDKPVDPTPRLGWSAEQ